MTSDTSEHPRVPEGRVQELYEGSDARRRVLGDEPGFHNVLGYEAAYASDPGLMDFLDPASPLFDVKRLSTRLYMDFFSPHLDRLPERHAALDAGCGIGRFTLELADRFDRVIAFDPCRSSLSACRRHLRDRRAENVELHWADTSWLDSLEPSRFDAVFATELICYLGDPARELKRLARVLRPDGLLFVSVEGLLGGLAASGAPTPDAAVRALAGDPVLVENDRYVTYFDRARLNALLADAGVRPVAVRESHFFAEGVFWQSVDDDRLADPAYCDEIARLDGLCGQSAAMRGLGRVLAAIGAIGGP